jgi:GTP-binding protein HflX
LYKTDPSTVETAILVGVVTPDRSRWVVRDNLDELEQLARTAGAVVTDRVTQNLNSIVPATYIGSGKVQTLKQMASAQDTDLVIFDDDLAPVQVRNLEEQIGCKLLDRSGLILDVFAGRASTAAAQTQVEMAQLEYLRTRLTRRWTHLSRQKGGIGTKGPGETQIEMDRRLIDKRIATLKERLEEIDRQRQTQRKQRDQHTRLALVGYTNAGKSTLMNVLAEEAHVQAEDQLFATLDATTRTMQLGDMKPVLVSDTVGFIRKLPHNLIESFKSTLDEVRESDILIHVVDVSHPRYEEQIRVVDETLKEIGADEQEVLMVFNKIDKLDDTRALRTLRKKHTRAAFTSAIRGIGTSSLKKMLREIIEENYVEREVYIPAAESELIAYIHRAGEVVSKDYTVATTSEESTPKAVAHMQFKVPKAVAGELDAQLISFSQLTPVASPGGDGFGKVSPDNPSSGEN